jgi:hypothetical protein
MSETARPSYTAESLERAMSEFETHYGMSSVAFYKAHQTDTLPARMPRFDRHVWASFYEDVQRLRAGDDVLGRVERALVTA